MTTDEDQLRALFDELSGRQRATGTDGAWLAARLRRRRARQLAASAAVLVVGVGILTLALPHRDGAELATDTPTPQQTVSPATTAPHTLVPPVPPALTASTGQQLVVVQGTRLELLDVDSGRRTPLTTDPRLRNHDRLDVLWVDGQLVMLGNDNTGAGNGPTDVFATTAGPGSTLKVIGQAGYLRPSEHADRVWLVSDVANNDGEGSKLTEVDLRGRTHSSATFPKDFGVEPFAGGFLRSTLRPDDSEGDDNTEFVDAQGRVLHTYRGRVSASTPTTAVLQVDDPSCTGRCRVRVLTAGSPVQEREVTFDEVPYLTESVLTPDGSRLYVEELIDGDGPRPGRLSELDLRDGSRHVIDSAWTAPYWGPSMTVSPDGTWGFFTDANGKNVDALDLATHRAYRVDGDFATITGLALSSP